ncbi:hypothetical protein T484DRAFT_1792980, partial [Baffinella frigidus]
MPVQVVQRLEGALAEAHTQHAQRVQETALSFDQELKDTKERNLALAARVEELEKSDVVVLTGEGQTIPCDISEEDFILYIAVEELEKSDVVVLAGKGQKIPCDISEADRVRLEKTLREQDVLLSAYHKENERLVVEAKALQEKVRDKDHALFLENQRLMQKNHSLQ